MLRQFQRAIEDFGTIINMYRKAIDWYNDSLIAPKAYYGRALPLGELGQHALAEEDFRKACELDGSLC